MPIISSSHRIIRTIMQPPPVVLLSISPLFNSCPRCQFRLYPHTPIFLFSNHSGFFPASTWCMRQKVEKVTLCLVRQAFCRCVWRMTILRQQCRLANIYMRRISLLSLRGSWEITLFVIMKISSANPRSLVHVQAYVRVHGEHITSARRQKIQVMTRRENPDLQREW